MAEELSEQRPLCNILAELVEDGSWRGYQKTTINGVIMVDGDFVQNGPIPITGLCCGDCFYLIDEEDGGDLNGFFLFLQIFSTVELSVDVAAAFVCYVSIYLGCDDILVAEEFLDGS